MTIDQPLAVPTRASRPVGDPVIVDADPVRTRIVAAALAVGALSVAAMVAWRPWGARNDFAYADIAPIRDHLWVGTLIDGTGFAVAAIALSLATVSLVRQRGRRLADVGAVLAVLGAVTSAGGSLAHAAVGWLATSQAASPSTGKALLHFADDRGGRLMAPAIVGYLLVTLGTLLMSAALLRSGALPRWVPITIVSLTVLDFLVPPRGQDFVEIASMAMLVCVAWLFATRSRARV